jgi:hypothetical protein
MTIVQCGKSFTHGARGNRHALLCRMFDEDGRVSHDDLKGCLVLAYPAHHGLVFAMVGL